MSSGDERLREIIAHQAGDWFLAHRAGRLSAVDRQSFDAWLATSPLHVEEYLGVALLVRSLPEAADDPEMPIETILARMQEQADTSASPLQVHATPAMRSATRPPLRHVSYWAAAAVVIAALGTTLWWSSGGPVSERYATRHGEMRTWRLPDQSTLRLNTDTAVRVRFTRAERFVEVERGEALFEVAHESSRPFRVISATADAEAVGTAFIVYRATDETLVTVLEGRVAVSARDVRGSSVALGAGQQARVAPGAPPTRAMSVDVQRQTAWMRRQLIFEEQPLVAVAAEFNRYAPVPIEIASPTLRALVISGTFSVDDVDTFVAFLRSLDGVRVDVTSSHIRVEESSGARK